MDKDAPAKRVIDAEGPPKSGGDGIARDIAAAPPPPPRPPKRRLSLAPDESLVFHIKDPNHPPTTYVETIVHLFKGNVGPGLFAMGDAFKNGGVGVAPILVLLIAIICVHCQHVLVSCSEKMRLLRQEASCPDYADTVELCLSVGPERLRAFSKTARKIVNVFICITQLGFCCIYFVFISTNVQQILHAHKIETDVHWIMLLTFWPIWFTSLITNLKWLTPVSLTANICMVLGLSITLYYALCDGLPPISEREAYTDLARMALFFGTAIFAFEGITLVLPLRNSMAKPQNFARPLGVLNVGMVMVTFLFIFAGFVGFMKWGSEVGGSLTLNLGDTLLAQSVKLMVSTGVMFGYALQFFIPVQIMWPGFKELCEFQSHPYLGELVFRTLLVVLTLTIAELVPALALFMSLIGAFCSTTLALVFPPFIEMLIRDDDNKGPSYWIYVKNFIILLLAFIGFTTGTYESVTRLFKHFVLGQ